MTVTYSSPSFTITGGFRSGTATAASTKTSLFATGVFTSDTTEDLLTRSIWIWGGTGAGQFRKISNRVDSDEVDIVGKWETVPDATSTFLVSHNGADCNSVNAAYVISDQGDAQTTDLSQRGINARCAGRLIIGNGSTRTYFCFEKGSYTSSYPVTSAETAAIHIRNGNAVLQMGHYLPQSDVSYDGIKFQHNQIEGAWSREVVWTEAGTSYIYMSGSQYDGLAQRDESNGSTRGSATLEINGNGVLTDCTFNNVDFRGFGLGIEEKRNIYTSTLYYFPLRTTYPDGLLLQTIGATPAIVTTGSVAVGSIGRFINPIIKSDDLVLATGVAGIDGHGDCGPSRGIHGELINPIWNRRVTHANPASGTFEFSTYQTDLKEYYEFSALVRNLAGTAISGALIALNPIAGDIQEETNYYVGTTNSNGEETIQALTGYWDERNSNYNALATTVPIITEDSYYLFQARIRYPSAIATVASIDFTSLKFDMILDTDLTGATETSVDVTAMHLDPDSNGTLIIETDSSAKVRVRFTGTSGDSFTIPSTSFSGDNASAGNAVTILRTGATAFLPITQITDSLYTTDGSSVTGVTMTDSRSSPVSWQSKNWSFTIVGNLTTNPSLDVEDIYNWWKYYSSQNANIPGTSLNAGRVHDVFDNTRTATSAGSEWDSSAEELNTYGVRVVDENGDPFPGILSMQSDDETIYEPPIIVPIKVTVKDAATLALIQNARVYIETAAGGPASAGDVLVNTLTDSNGEVNDTVQYDGNQPVTGTVRKGTA